MSAGSPGATNPFRSPGSYVPRTGHVPLLPRPAQVLKSQTSPKICLVCGKRGCVLVSHRRFAEQALARRRASYPNTPTKGKAPVGPSPWHVQPPEQIVQYPIKMDQERHQLLALWSQEWGRVKRGPERHLFPVRWLDLILPTATKHAPLFHAVLAVSASMWAMAHDSMHEAANNNLRLADQALTHTCSNQATASLDECILAAILLTIIYQAQGNAYETERRFSGLVHLVRSRGGPHYLGLSGVVAELLLYIDHVQACLFGVEPVWRMTLPALKIGVTPRLGAGFRALSPSETLDTDVLLAVDSICRTADIFEQPSQSRNSESGVANSFGYLSMISEYQLARCAIMFHGTNTWNECVCLGLLLFDHVVLRNDGVITAIVRKAEHRFWIAIENALAHGGSRDVPPCLLLWMLMTALSPSVLTESQYRYSAIRKIRAARISAAITSWEHLQSRVLDDFVWVRATQEETFRDIWLEVEGVASTPQPGSAQLISGAPVLPSTV